MSVPPCDGGARLSSRAAAAPSRGSRPPPPRQSRAIPTVCPYLNGRPAPSSRVCPCATRAAARHASCAHSSACDWRPAACTARYVAQSRHLPPPPSYAPTPHARVRRAALSGGARLSSSDLVARAQSGAGAAHVAKSRRRRRRISECVL
eukprot:scaffold122884_cov28-Tisochrysis_lutea.AAC.1